jgi:hypothetical protein
MKEGIISIRGTETGRTETGEKITDSKDQIDLATSEPKLYTVQPKSIDHRHVPF